MRRGQIRCRDPDSYLPWNPAQSNVGQGILVERLQERGQCLVQHARQSTERSCRALVSGGEALDQGKARLRRTHHLTQALLQNSARGRAVPNPIEFYATRTVSGVPSAVKWLRRAARI